jgi:hypothetical protein
VKDDKVQSLCLHHDVSRDRPATRGLQSIQVTVQLNCTLAHKGRLQAIRNVIQDGILPPGQLSLVEWVFTMDENMEQCLLHHVPTELAIDQSALTPPSEVSEGGQRVYAAIHSKFQDTSLRNGGRQSSAKCSPIGSTSKLKSLEGTLMKKDKEGARESAAGIHE